MKKNNYRFNDEIDLIEVTTMFWKNKILLLSITIISFLLTYLLFSFEEKQYKIVIKIKNPPASIFFAYTNLEPYISVKTDINDSYISIFKSNFLSLDNLDLFLRQTKTEEFSDFKAYLKLNNVSIEDYFFNRIGEIKERNIVIPDYYYIIFNNKLDGIKFLNNYTVFVKNITIAQFKNDLKLIIKEKILSYNEALYSAEIINLDEPLIKTNLMNTVNEPDALVFKGSKLLKRNTVYMENLVKALNDNQKDLFQYNPILQKAVFKEEVTQSFLAFYYLGALVFSLLLFFSIIYFRNKLKAK
jgi:LPS O-antigen subunit length determinant protein (WzzB/FepE family)